MKVRSIRLWTKDENEVVPNAKRAPRLCLEDDKKVG